MSMYVNVNKIDFAYKKANVLQNLSVQFEAGKIYGLLGSNGEGKSTLFRNICGLLFNQHGEITVLNRNPSLRQTEFLQNIYLLPEEIETVHLTPEQYQKNYSLFYPSFNLSNLQHYLDEFEVPKSQLLSSMSLGQKKKFYISFALACNCPILLMDEPSNGLDIVAKSVLRKLLANYINENNLVVISTHQVRDLEQLIDHVCILKNGQITFNYSINEISENLSFGKVSNTNNAVYCDENGIGIEILTNSKGKVDLEILFKSAMLDISKLNKALKGELA